MYRYLFFFNFQEKLKKLVWSSQAFQNNQEEMTTIWEACEDRMFSLEDHERQLGLGSEVCIKVLWLFRKTRVCALKMAQSKGAPKVGSEREKACM